MTNKETNLNYEKYIKYQLEFDDHIKYLHSIGLHYNSQGKYFDDIVVFKPFTLRVDNDMVIM